jgi:hypothetical protein
MANEKARINLDAVLKMREKYIRESDYSKCPAPEIHLLGEVVVWFGNLEWFLEISIWKLLTPEDDEQRVLMAQAMTAEMPFRLKVKAFDRAFRQKGVASAESELNALVSKLNSAETERNQLMHSAWSWDGRDFMRVKLPKSAKGLGRNFQRMPAKLIKEKRDCIVAASESLVLFISKYIQT